MVFLTVSVLANHSIHSIEKIFRYYSTKKSAYTLGASLYFYSLLIVYL